MPVTALDQPTEPASRIGRLGTFDALVTTVLFLGIVLTCGLTPMQSDTWWQLRAGHDMWASHRVLLTDIYSHTAYGAFWLNHEWLAEVIFYLLLAAGGLPLVTLFAAALIAGGWALTWRLTRGPADRKLLWVGSALVSSAGWWEPRPHAFSLLFIPLLVFLLVRDRLWWLPPMFFVWANCHGGVMLGIVLLGAGLGAQTLADPRRWRGSALVLIACVIAATATPLGLSFWTEIPRSLNRINLYTLDEWKAPRLTEGPMLPFWIFASAWGVMVVRNLRRLRQPNPGEAALHACALVLLTGALSAVRNVGPFLMVAVPSLSYLLPERVEKRVRTDAERPVLNLVLMSLATLGVVIALSWAYVNGIERLKWTPVPAGAVAALRQCPGNLYNRYDEGGPLLWFVPERKVFLDGRQDPYPADMVLEHIRMETGQTGYQPVFARYGIHCAFLPSVSPVAQQLTAAGWKTRYQDGRWLVLSE